MNIRDDFALLRKNPHLTYLDSSCVSLKPDIVVSKIREYYEEYPACAGRSAHFLAQKVTAEVDKSRDIMRKFLGAGKSSEIIFTRNTTEGINLVANSLDFNTVLTTDKEHNSNHVPWVKKSLRGKKHLQVPTNDGVLDIDLLNDTLEKNDIDIISINHISNLDGVINPVRRISRIAHKHGALVLVDGAQSAGHMDIDVNDLGVDFYALSGHKMMGPSGTGVLYGRKRALEKLDTFIVGGDTVKNTTTKDVVWNEIPHLFEAGLQNYAGILGLGRAASYLRKIGLEKIRKHCDNLRKQLENVLSAYDFEVLGKKDKTSIVTIIPKKLHAHDLSLLLSSNDICTRSGAFCVHSWFNKYNKKAALRFSIHAYNEDNDILRVKEVLNKIRSII